MKNVKTMSDEELKALVEQSDLIQQARAELENREDEKEERKEKEKRQAYFASAEFKQLQQRYQEVLQQLKEFKGHELTVTIPITFTFAGRLPEQWSGFCCSTVVLEYDIDGKMGTVKGLNKVQHKLLQVGLEQVIENACDDLGKLFPAVLKEFNRLEVAYNRVMKAAAKKNLTYKDLQ